MQRQDFHFELPEELIAKYPTDSRTASRLLHLNASDGAIAHRQFADICELLNPGDLLVVNNTRVIPARLFGSKASGGKVEILVERLTGESECLAHVKASKSPKAGSQIILENGATIDVLGRDDALFQLALPTGQSLLALLESSGHIPLPPYIDRADEQSDKERYQTVYNKKPGAVAAPTAGLHFDKQILSTLQEKGVDTAEVTLHVGAGTFQPVRVDDIESHKMHSEVFEISEEAAAKINDARQRGNRIIAVGTTSVRTLESAAQKLGLKQGDDVKPMNGETDIFLYPGKKFHLVDALITNFHLPESTLIMLVAAFAGYDQTMTAYESAVENKYRFFSYGDAMFIER